MELAPDWGIDGGERYQENLRKNKEFSETQKNKLSDFQKMKIKKGISNEDFKYLTDYFKGSSSKARNALKTLSTESLHRLIDAQIQMDNGYGEAYGDDPNSPTWSADYGTYSFPIKSKEYKNGLYNSPEEVAYAFGMDYNEKSINENKEYGANIYAVEIDGKTLYTIDGAFKGFGSNSIANMAIADHFNRALLALSPIKSDMIPVGSVHTHSRSDWDGSNFFSKKDDVFLLGETYMVAPDGSLHYLQGEPSSYNYKWPDEDTINKKGMKYGEVVRWGLPYDPNTTPFKP